MSVTQSAIPIEQPEATTMTAVVQDRYRTAAVLATGVTRFKAGRRGLRLSRWLVCRLRGGPEEQLAPKPTNLTLGQGRRDADGVLPHEFARFAAVPIGVGLAWLGYSLWSKRHQDATASVPGSVAVTNTVNVPV